MLKFVYFVYTYEYIGMASISIWWIHCGIITINDHIKWYIFYIIDCRVKLNLLFTHSLYNYNLLSMYTYLYCWIYIYKARSLEPLYICIYHVYLTYFICRYDSFYMHASKAHYCLDIMVFIQYAHSYLYAKLCT